MALVQALIGACIAVACCLSGACDRPTESMEHKMATFNVANSTQLAAALTSAQGGDRIVLAAGSYGDLRLTNRTYTGNVEIVSADPTQPPRSARSS
jgi:hypothetical protein